MAHESDKHIETETIVVTTEDGVVMTGNRAQAFEARLMNSLRKPFYIMGMLMMVMFVFLMGLTLVLNNINSSVKNTDRIAKATTSPAAQAKQQEVIENLLLQMNCQDQRNLQKLVDELAAAGATSLKGIGSLVDQNCK